MVLEELKFFIRKTKVGVQEVDGIILNIYEMVVIDFFVTYQANCIKFFEEIFLVANISPKVVFVMFFLTLSNADVDFLEQEFR